MSEVIIIGGARVGRTAMMAAALLALRAQGVAVVLAERMPPPPPDPFELGAALLDAALVRKVPQFARPLPIPAALVANLPKRASWQVTARSLPRPREQRTRRDK